MAVTMALFWVSLVLSVIGSNADGEFSVLHSPDSLKFSGSSIAEESWLKEVFSAALGLSVEENSQWDGLYVSDPFKTPEAVVEVLVDGVPSLGGSAALKSKSFPLKDDEYEPHTYNEIKHRIHQRFTAGGNKLVNVKLSDPEQLTTPNFVSVFGEIKVPKVPKQSLQHLKFSVEEDHQFLRELETLKAITERVQAGVVKADNIIDFFSFRFSSLHALSDYHGSSSLQTKEAKKLLGEALQEMSNAFVKAYDDAVLVTAVVTDIAHTRRRSIRAVNETPTTTTESEVSDDEYDADYPAIFNILLWFGVVFVFTLVSIVYAIMDMDPGRDSIIYRMTSTRMKKDN
ncbi:ATPase H(+)-transporting accessory protein 2-like [Anticarsia gemmatalis]|uniref:ATPase H(+)-transporting accessory protein 2-like n=1 Tax=Anticarsia gemmatalis TaxID=129554 RepID=UPI003F76D615